MIEVRTPNRDAWRCAGCAKRVERDDSLRVFVSTAYHTTGFGLCVDCATVLQQALERGLFDIRAAPYRKVNK